MAVSLCASWHACLPLPIDVCIDLMLAADFMGNLYSSTARKSAAATNVIDQRFVNFLCLDTEDCITQS